MKLFSATISIGNYLNFGTPKGSCKGFKLAILGELSGIKAISGDASMGEIKGHKKSKYKISMLDLIVANLG